MENDGAPLAAQLGPLSFCRSSRRFRARRQGISRVRSGHVTPTFGAGRDSQASFQFVDQLLSIIKSIKQQYNSQVSVRSRSKQRFVIPRERCPLDESNSTRKTNINKFPCKRSTCRHISYVVGRGFIKKQGDGHVGKRVSDGSMVEGAYQRPMARLAAR